MITNDFFGLVFFIVLLISAVVAVFSNNAVFSIFALVCCFLASSSILFLYKCEFVSFLFIVIYVGAIAVLFLFVIMMLDTKVKTTEKIKLRFIPTGFYVGLIFLFGNLINNFDYWFKMNNPYYFSVKYNEYFDWLNKTDIFLEIETIGFVLYTYYVVFFLISGFLLFLAVLGSVSLTSDCKDRSNLLESVKRSRSL